MNHARLQPTILVFLATLASIASAATCLNHPDLGPNLRRYTGLYENGAFGYTTRLPQGVTGLDTDNPEYQRGFVVILPQEGGTLSVYAQTNSSEYNNPNSAADADLGYLHTERSQTIAIHKAAVPLGTRPATELTVQFHCSNDPHPYRHIAIFSLGTDRRFLYTLTWEGPATRAAEATTLIHALEHSWKFIPAR